MEGDHKTQLPASSIKHPSDGSTNSPVNLEISPDKMSAFITVLVPDPIPREDIELILREGNVVYGICDEIIDMAASGKFPGSRLLVAMGTPPVNGKDAVISYKCRSSNLTGRPVELSNGKIDYYDLDLIHCVEPGDVLAALEKATPGEPGSTVSGDIINPKPGQEIQMIAGKNVQLTDENCTALATGGGHLIVEGNKISVSPVYEVQGDVDFTTGKIKFNGSVVVKGNICEGFQVIADGNVIVTNIISGGFVECTGEVRVKNGIVGRNKSEIKAGGSVFTRFIENSIVSSGADVIVSEAIMHSKVNAAGNVTVAGKGVIVGGIVRAGEEINCKLVGSNLATVTELEAGTTPELKQEYSRLTKEKQAKEADFNKGTQALKYLKGIKESMGKLTSEQMNILLKVNNSQINLRQDIETLTVGIQRLEHFITGSEHGRIKVEGTVHPGVKITIGTACSYIRDEYSFASFTKDGGEIRVSPFK